MAYMIDPMALKYYDSTDSNSTVIRAQSFGSYTAQFVNCSLILFLILSSHNLSRAVPFSEFMLLKKENKFLK